MSIFTDSPTIGDSGIKKLVSSCLGALRALRTGTTSNGTTMSTVASGTGSVTLLEANPYRVKYRITNTDSNALYVLDNPGTATATNFSQSVAANATISEINYTGKVTGLWAGDSSGLAIITEYTTSS